MNPTEPIRVRGIVRLVITGPDGSVKADDTHENLVTNAGRQHLIDRLQGTSSAVADYIAIGTSSTAAAAGDTTLVAEVARAQGTLSQPDAHTDRCVYTFPAGTGTGTIREVGRLNASSGGTLMGRAVVADKIKGAGDTLTITYDFLYAAS
jgi:hypothetical protein